MKAQADKMLKSGAISPKAHAKMMKKVKKPPVPAKVPPTPAKQPPAPEAKTETPEMEEQEKEY